MNKTCANTAKINIFVQMTSKKELFQWFF